ncbi:MAG: SDR family NAD(P)-dependent oxidoreductase [Polyangiaceae bacterium]
MATSPVVLITGAASGIGRATALEFARRGATLELVDLDIVALRAVGAEAQAGGAGGVTTHELNVADERQVEAYAKDLSGRGVALDVLVNNAGVLVAAGFLETEADDWSWILGVNLLGVVHVTKQLLPGMLARGKGHVINVVSASAFWNPPALTAYGTSKYALMGLSEALREEMRPHGIRVTAVCPGFVSTPIVDHMRLRGSYARPDMRARARALAEQSGVTAELVAKAIVRATERDVAVLPVGRQAWLLSWSKRLFPRLLARFVRSASGSTRASAEEA